MAEEEHEVSLRRRRACRKRAQDSAARTRRHSLRLAAKEDPFYVDATSKAMCVKAAQLDLVRASARLEALARSGVLERPPPARFSTSKLCCLGRACGLPDISNNVEEVVASTCCCFATCYCCVFTLLGGVSLPGMILLFMLGLLSLCG